MLIINFKSLMKAIVLIVLAVALIVVVSIAYKGTYQKRATQMPTTAEKMGATDASSTNPSAQVTAEPTVQEIFLTLSEPLDGTTVYTSVITVKGQTVAGADVFINDAEIKSDTQGTFQTKLTLDEGENLIYITANDANGNYSEKSITVTYESSQTQ